MIRDIRPGDEETLRARAAELARPVQPLHRGREGGLIRVRTGDGPAALDTGGVHGILRRIHVAALPGAVAPFIGMILVHEKALALADLGRMLGGTPLPDTDTLDAVLVGTTEPTAALAVTGIEGTADPETSKPGGRGSVIGVLPDGTPVLDAGLVADELAERSRALGTDR